MRCRYCGDSRFSLVGIWEDKAGATRRRFGCLSCGRKFDVAQGGKPAAARAPRLSKYARR